MIAERVRSIVVEDVDVGKVAPEVLPGDVIGRDLLKQL